MVCHCICCLKVRGFLGLISLLEFIGVKNSFAGIIMIVVVVAVAVEMQPHFDLKIITQFC